MTVAPGRARCADVRCLKRADTYIAFLHMACAIITWRAAGVLG